MTKLAQRRSLRFAFAGLVALSAGLVGGGLDRFGGAAVASPTQPSAADRQIVSVVSMLIEGRHMSRHRLDDEISQRALKTFIKELDPLKLFFYQQDVD